MTQRMVSPQAFVQSIKAKRIYLGGFSGEPTAVIEALVRHPIQGNDARITSVLIPGINRQDVAAAVPEGRVESYFVTPALRTAFAAGCVSFRPMHYTAIYQDLSQRRDIELAILRVSPPRAGRVSLGLAHDFGQAMITAGVPIAGMVDAATPYVMDGTTLAVNDLVALIDGSSQQVSLLPDPLRPDLAEIARLTAGLVANGCVVQTGLGSAPNAILAALREHKNLQLHGGMVTDAGLALIDSGAVMLVTTGAAVCSADWITRLADEPRVRFRPVDVTHGAATLAAIPNLVAINSALEVDLFGQANGEMLAGRQVSGHGGLADFVRGGRLSPNGRSIIVLSSTGDRGQVSRIVPTLPAGTPVAVTRGDIDCVVTEFGVAEVRDTDIDVRAARLIGIAAPAFRASLANAWDCMRRAM
jgi:acyl-CoA hydrolase